MNNNGYIVGLRTTDELRDKHPRLRHRENETNDITAAGDDEDGGVVVTYSIKS